MTVHFIGAGPGAPDLITVRGLRLIRQCPVVLYAGSLVPAEVVAQAGDEAPLLPRVIDTAPLALPAILAEIERAHRDGLDVARVHCGDPSFYGAIAEQARRLQALGIDYDVTPGVPAFAAAAAALGQELTLPGIAQSVVLTRTAVRASPMPPAESLAAFAATGATLPGDRGLSRVLAGSGDHPRHARDRPRADQRAGHHPDGADPGRPRARA
jgi:precorrin-4/cobalt-precorrin-4 C11-methyltransferase